MSYVESARIIVDGLKATPFALPHSVLFQRCAVIEHAELRELQSAGEDVDSKPIEDLVCLFFLTKTTERMFSR